MIIKNLSVDDIGEMRSIYLSYLDTGLPVERLKYLIEKFPAKGAFENNKVVGFCYTNDFAPDILSIANIFISEEHRSKGLGEKILNEIFSEAKKLKYVSAILSNSDLYDTKLEKKSPNSFYTKLGFHILFQTTNTIVYLKNI